MNEGEAYSMVKKSLIKAIDTEYNGMLFRSRLEARWAVFFDVAGIKYEYEPEGFEHDGIKYLPDFYLPDMDVYVEVKPDRPGMEEDILKCYKMIYWGGPLKAIIFLGNIPGPCKEGAWHFPCMYYDVSSNSNDNITCGWWVFYNRLDIDKQMNFFPVPETTGIIMHAHFRQPFTVLPAVNEVIGMFDGAGSYYDLTLRAHSDKELDLKNKLEDKKLMDIELEENPYLHHAFKKARTARFEFKKN